MPHQRVDIDPDIHARQAGHSRHAELVLRKLGAGMMPETILIDHPLTLDDIRAA